MEPTADAIDELLPRIGLAVDGREADGAELNDPSGVLGALRAELIEQVETLLRDRRELLMSLLYRIDVDEALVVDTFRSYPYDTIASRLADLIIERQVQKVQIRRAYRNRTH